MLQTYLGIDPLTGKQRRTTRRGFKTAKEARQAETMLQLQVEEHGFDIQSTSYTFQDVAEMWLENYKTTVKPTTYQNVRSMYLRMLDRYFKNMKLENISVAYCQKVFINLSKTYVKYSIYTSVLGRIFKFALMIDAIQSNPLDRLIRPKQKPSSKSDNVYSKKELQEFFGYMDTHKDPAIPIFFWLLAYTGLRKGEALALRWKDLDFDNKILSVSHTVVWLDGKHTLQSPKTATSKRIISLDDTTLAKLRKWKLQQKKDHFKSGKKYFGDENYIFTNRRCQSFSRDYVQRNLRNIIKQNDLKPITIHGFRHTHASLLFEAGIEPKIISDRLGHSNIKTTLDLYTHINQKQKVALVDRFADFMAAE